MEITVKRKTVYGNEMIYPVDEAAKAFANIAGTKTLSREALRVIKDKLGYQINVEHEAIDL